MFQDRRLVASGMEAEIRFMDFGEEVAKVLGPDRRGHWCGYVRVPDQHPFAFMEYKEPINWPRWLARLWMDRPMGKRGVLTIIIASTGEVRVEMYFDVHGSITYSRIRKDGGWWIGFDCGHAGDNLKTCPPEYAEEETRSLARQVEAAWTDPFVAWNPIEWVSSFFGFVAHHYGRMKRDWGLE